MAYLASIRAENPSVAKCRVHRHIGVEKLCVVAACGNYSGWRTNIFGCLH